MNISQDEREQDGLRRSRVYVNVNKEIAIKVQELTKLLLVDSAMGTSGFAGEITKDHDAVIQKIKGISNNVQSAMNALISSQDTQEPMQNAIRIVREALQDADPIVRAFAEGVETRLCRANNELNPTVPITSSTDLYIEQLQKALEGLRQKVEAQPIKGSDDKINWLLK